MTWPKLFSTTLGLAALAAGAITLATPKPAQADGCGNHNGRVCTFDCTKECSNGGCCGWSLTYYRVVAD